MMQTALGTALGLYIVLLAVVLKECAFLNVFRWEIWREFGEAFLYFSLAIVLNLFAGIYAVLRTVALNNTGDKLSHLEKQLRGRTTISAELTERIREQK